jgi:hypothetical protein
MFDFFYTPFPKPKRSRKNILRLIIFAVCATLFVLIFNPFSIRAKEDFWFVNLVLISMGLVLFLSVFLMEFVIPRLWKKLFEKWNLGKAIVWYTLVILFVAAVMFLYKSYWEGFRSFTLIEYGLFLSRILGIALITSFFIVGIISYTHRRNFTNISSAEFCVLKSPNAPSLEIRISELMYIVSDDNYVDIHLDKRGIREKIVFRSSLKNIESQIVHPLTPIKRCHRRYLVNLNYFTVKDKRSRSTSIELNTYGDVIPVSSQYSRKIVKQLQLRH